MTSSSALLTPDPTFSLECLAPSQLQVLDVTTLILWAAWQSSPHPWDSVPSHFDLLGLVPTPAVCSQRSSWAPLPAQHTLLGPAHCRRSTFTEWTNLKWSIVGRMKKCWVNLPAAAQAHPKDCQVLSDHLCPGTPLALSLFPSAHHLSPSGAWVQIRTSLLSSCVDLGA